MFEYIYAGLTIVLQGMGWFFLCLVLLIFLGKFYLWLRGQCNPFDHGGLYEPLKKHGTGKSINTYHSSSDAGSGSTDVNTELSSTCVDMICTPSSCD